MMALDELEVPLDATAEAALAALRRADRGVRSAGSFWLTSKHGRGVETSVSTVPGTVILGCRCGRLDGNRKGRWHMELLPVGVPVFCTFGTDGEPTRVPTVPGSSRL